eukprot:TRINITY_DN42961_c0_g1_i1.p1 TRINITY_DN42961_c0_g1~~TRINITY_DN42961_c0_g1_i1.p1  ORF type:complete len:123 (+),score=47.17 TRINITY_DN42961_c0_g1_i1:143-511(+)
MADADQETFTLRPDYRKKFRATQAREVMRKVLAEKLDGAEYSADSTSTCAKEAADLIRDRLKGLDFDRYKMIVNVCICEQKGDGVKMGCRCFWDSDTDSYAQEVYMNKSLFAIATVFGVYHY